LFSNCSSTHPPIRPSSHPPTHPPIHPFMQSSSKCILSSYCARCYCGWWPWSADQAWQGLLSLELLGLGHRQ
jgi:hypothetical protein